MLTIVLEFLYYVAVCPVRICRLYELAITAFPVTAGVNFTMKAEKFSCGGSSMPGVRSILFPLKIDIYFSTRRE